MMKAASGVSVLVTGRSSAMVSAGPMPGRMPTSVPSVTPTKAQPRLASVSAVEKPASRCCSVVIARSPRKTRAD